MAPGAEDKPDLQQDVMADISHQRRSGVAAVLRVPLQNRAGHAAKLVGKTLQSGWELVVVEK
jgi:hypothetical protein